MISDQIGTTPWFDSVFKENKELFSELDTLLRGLDRIFNPENLPISVENLTTRNFYAELTTVKDAILRVLSILELVIPESKKNAFWFQKYAEQSYVSDRKRDLLRSILYRQDTPEKSLLLLYDSFINLKVIVSDLLKGDTVSYMGYKNYGDIIAREIRENHYFDPFKKEINPDFDKIRNKEITAIVRSIKDRKTKRLISTIFIFLYRFLRYLGHIETSSHLQVSLNCAFVILVLLRSEIRAFINYLKEVSSEIEDKSLQDIIDSLAFQFSMETKRVYEQELKDLLRLSALNRIRGKIENSSGIITNLTEQCIVQLAQKFNPSIKGEDIFPSFVTRHAQSVKLREDIYVLYEFIEILESIFDKKEIRLKVFDSLRSYMLYFESFTFRLLRYDDYEEFARFFNEFFSITPETISGDASHKILEKLHRFKIFLETTLRLISQRTELRDKPIDKKKAEEILRQFLPEELT